MKLAISNLSWLQEYNSNILAFLDRENVLLETTRKNQNAYEPAVSMQSIILNSSELYAQLFQAGEEAEKLGIKTLVLGAPEAKNKYSGNFVVMLREFAKRFKRTYLAIEPVAHLYGGEVLSTTHSVELLLNQVGCYNIGMCLDSENFRLNGYDVWPTLPNSIKHIHIAPEFHKEAWDWDYINKFISKLHGSPVMSTDTITIEMFQMDEFTVYKTIKKAKEVLKKYL